MPQAIAIKSMFNKVSRSYDILNDLLSLGIHRLWKKALVREMVKSSPASILDCATGTGDIAIAAKAKSSNTTITGIDFSEGMLEVAKGKTSDINWQIQDIMSLPFNDNQFEVSSISYGIRNVEDYKGALKELSRVTTDKICILEFGAPQNKVFRTIYFKFMNLFMPVLGMLFGKKDAYKYLVESSEAFPCGEFFVSEIKTYTKFSNVKCEAFFGGVTYLYTATK